MKEETWAQLGGLKSKFCHAAGKVLAEQLWRFDLTVDALADS